MARTGSIDRIEGPNFEILHATGGVARVRVWRRPDLSRDEGARCAALLLGHMERIAVTADGCLFDLTEATTTWGPATQRAVEQMTRAWELAGHPIVVVASEEAIQRIVLRQLLRQVAPRCGTLVTTRQEGLALFGITAP